MAVERDVLGYCCPHALACVLFKAKFGVIDPHYILSNSIFCAYCYFSW